MNKELKKRLAELYNRSDDIDSYLKKFDRDGKKVEKLFDLGKLDPDLSAHQRVLLAIVADVMFPLRRMKTPKWTAPKLRKLVEDFAALAKERPGLSAVSICTILARRPEYKCSPEALRRTLTRSAMTFQGEYPDLRLPGRRKGLAISAVPSHLRRAIKRILAEL